MQKGSRAKEPGVILLYCIVLYCIDECVTMQRRSWEGHVSFSMI